MYAFGRESALGLGGNSARNAANPVAPKEVCESERERERARGRERERESVRESARESER